jgi:hypothetical protein
MISELLLHNGLAFFLASFNAAMCTTYAMDTCIETHENIASGIEVHFRYNLAYVRVWNMPGICLIYA